MCRVDLVANENMRHPLKLMFDFGRTRDKVRRLLRFFMTRILYYLSILTFIILAGCSTQRPKNKKVQDLDVSESAKAPEWVYAPHEGCSSAHLCAAGEGESLTQADVRARKAIAAVFSTQIKSQFDIHKTSYSDDELSELKERVSDSVTEKVEGILKGVEISKRFEKDGLFFSLASLDKSKAVQSLKREIKGLDSELDHLYSLKRKSSVMRMMEILDERAGLSDKLIALKGGASQAPVTFAQIQNIKFNNNGYDKVFIRAGSDVPVSLSKSLSQMLSDSGYKVRSDLAVDYIIDLKFEAKEAYLKVSGFKKFVFTFSVLALNNLKEKVGSFNVTQTQTGRTEQDAFVRAKLKLQQEAQKKLSKLNLK